MKLGLIARFDNGVVYNPNMECSMPDCSRPVRGRGWCTKHYWRWYAYGDPNIIKGVERGQTTEQRFQRLFTEQEDGCWLWTGTMNHKGYGMFRTETKMMSAHRWAYVHWKGSIPEGLQLDHLCRVRHCVNPEHLEVVTNAENQRRSPITFANKTHCPYGHAYNEQNTYIIPKTGARACRICADRRRKTYQEKKERETRLNSAS